MTVTIPVIETQNLRLRGPQLSDYDALCAYFTDPRSVWNGGPSDSLAVWRMLMASTGQWQLRGHGLWFVTPRDSDDYIGFAGIIHHIDWPEPELGFGFTAAVEGKGIAFEAVRAARQAAATHFGLTRLPSYPSKDNTRSIALVKRLGATFESELALRGSTAHVYRHPQVQP